MAAPADPLAHDDASSPSDPTRPENSPRARSRLLDRVVHELELDAPAEDPHPLVPLPSRLATGELAWASVAAAALAAGRPLISLDPERIAVAYRSDRVLTIDGSAPPVWSPYSEFWRTADGWVRTHGNYPHHTTGLRTGLGLRDDATAEAVGGALARLTTTESVHAIAGSRGLAVPVAAEDPVLDESLRRRPLVEIRRIRTTGVTAPSRPTSTDARAGGADLPLRGVRVLDLTRVIAGPVCTRTLALLGADVLRIDPPHLPEPEWQHLDTGHGKRSALLDARTSRMHELLALADVVVLGYRPAALDRLGLRPELIAEQHPGVVVAHLSAWGTDHPESAGFDSLVQAASGIAMIESPDGDRPGVLPAQALDHSAGYLLAAAVTSLMSRRSDPGESWLVRTSLRRMAAELLGMPRRAEPDAETAIDTSRHVTSFDLDDRTLTTARPALNGLEFEAPHRFGADQPRW